MVVSSNGLYSVNALTLLRVFISLTAQIIVWFNRNISKIQILVSETDILHINVVVFASKQKKSGTFDAKNLPDLRRGGLQILGKGLFIFFLFLFKGFDELVLDVARHELVAGELHDERSAAARERAERGGIRRHFL